MALVSYSDSEASDSETENVVQPPPSDAKAPEPASTATKPSTAKGKPATSIVDRSNPRKIRVALPELKPEADEEQDGPARKKALTAADGGGAFSGFNALLPAPKRDAATVAAEKAGGGSGRKVFSLKTGAEPGFSREADAEMRREMADGEGGSGFDETIPKAGSLQTGSGTGTTAKSDGAAAPKLKGNAMMFKPLSVGRNQKRKKPVTKAAATPSLPAEGEGTMPVSHKMEDQAAPVEVPPPPKPKVSLFSLSSEDKSPPVPGPAPASGSGYQPLVYNTAPEAPPAGPERPATETIPEPTQPGVSTQASLDNIANDLNLSNSERRQLFGRHAAPAEARVLTFNTDKEYAANQEMAHSTDLAAAQHNPVRSVAPGKHTLQQLVNVASSQRDALEESFAAGRRNKKEAGSKYGW